MEKRGKPVFGRLFARGFAALALVLGVAAAIVFSDLDRHWPLDLSRKPDAFTQWRIRLLAATPDTCRRVLDRSAFSSVPATPRPISDGCGYEDGVVLSEPDAPVMRCPMAAAYAAWERHVVQPAAVAHLGGARVTGVRHFGTYACRNVNNRATGRRSQHATANAIDISGFSLSTGRTISILGDWAGDDADARFLRAVRDGACGLFAGVLSPDYNAAHRDHLHFDLGPFDICR